MALTPEQVTIRFDPLRQWMARVSSNQHSASANALERILRDLAGLIAEINTDDDGEPIDLTAILARLTAVEALAAEALETAVQQILLMPLPLSRDDVLAITDNALLTEGLDNLWTEGGDNLLLESA